MFERYTETARRVIFFARYEASMSGTPFIGPEHLLLGLVREDSALVKRFFPAGFGVESLRRRIEECSPAHEKIGVTVELPLSPEAKRVLAYAHEQSDRLGHRHIGTEHMLLGLLCARGTVAELILREHGLELESVRQKLEEDDEMGGEGRTSIHGREASYGLARGGSSYSMWVDHIGVATQGIEEALTFWRDALGLEVKHTETVEEQGVRVAMLPLGEPRIELLEPTGPDSPVAKFMEKRGPGIHHVAVRVPDIRAALARLKEKGAKLIDETPRVGAGGCLVAFIHPKSAGGVLLELVEHTGGE